MLYYPQVETQIVTMNDIRKMTPSERRRFFIESTTFLKRQRINYQEMAQMIRRKVPDFTNARMRNLRTKSQPFVTPSVKEAEALSELYSQELKEYWESIGEPSPQEREIMDLKDEIKYLNDLIKQKVREFSRKIKMSEEETDRRIKLSEDEKALLEKKIELLETENELLKRKLKDG